MKLKGIMVGNRRKLLKCGLPQIIFTDFDGCLTDDRVFLNEHGHEFVAANRKDGLAIGIMKTLGIEVVIISKEKNKVVTARAEKLDIVVYQGVDNKVEAIDQHLQRICPLSSPISFWYVGNDRNDIEALLRSDLAICPRDAIPEVRRICDVTLRTRGGYGIFSELLREMENAR